MNIYEQNFDLNLYKVFCTVAEMKNISRAAEALFVSQQAVSYSIKQLEAALGGRLFFRTPKGVELTPESEKLYLQVKEALNNIISGQHIFTEDKELKSGYIRIGCTAGLFDICVYKYVAHFHRAYPGIQIHIVSKPTQDLFKLLKTHDIDLMVRKLTKDEMPSKFSYKIFDRITNCMIGNEKYKELAKKGPISLKELNKYPLLVTHHGSYERTHLEGDFKKAGLELKPLMDFSSHTPIIALVKEGLGIGHGIKEMIEDELKNKTLFEIPVKGISFTDTVAMIYDEEYLTFAAGRFLEML